MSDLTEPSLCRIAPSMRVRIWNIQFWHLQRIYLCLLFLSEEVFHLSWNIENKLIIDCGQKYLYDFIKMEQQNIKFDNFKFDATPYIIAANSFSKQFKEQENKKSDHAFGELDKLISENLSECSMINEDLRKLQTENLNIHMELDNLKREEERQSHSSLDLKEGILL